MSVRSKMSMYSIIAQPFRNCQEQNDVVRHMGLWGQGGACQAQATAIGLVAAYRVIGLIYFFAQAVGKSNILLHSIIFACLL